MKRKSFYTKLLGARPLLVVCIALGVVSPTSVSAEAQKVAPGSEKTAEVVGYEQSFPALGTLVTFKTFSNDRPTVETAFGLAEQRVKQIASVLTDYDPNSETRQLSTTAVRAPSHVSDDLWEVLAASDVWFRRSDGAFDSSLGQLTSLWRKYRRAKKVPPSDQIQQALSQCGWQFVELDYDQRTVRFHQDGLRLDFGAIGKGYIVDQAFEVLLANELPCSLVDISGNMRCGAAPPGREGWRIQVSPLQLGGKSLRRVQLSHSAIATSGDLWQYSLVRGQRRSHILDPETGLGVPGPLAATVVASSATTADAMATVACILEWAEVQNLTQTTLKSSDAVGVLVARRDAGGKLTIHTTAGFPSHFESSVE